jgi:protein phosphatase 4 regulatory subunit 3
MAQPEPDQTTDKKRVKVYELRNGDWFDRGTGFCTAEFVTVRLVIFSGERADRHRH